MESIGLVIGGIVLVMLLFFTSIVRGNAWKSFYTKLAGKDKKTS